MHNFPLEKKNDFPLESQRNWDNVLRVYSFRFLQKLSLHINLDKFIAKRNIVNSTVFCEIRHIKAV